MGVARVEARSNGESKCPLVDDKTIGEGWEKKRDKGSMVCVWRRKAENN